jgi:hypothetical protein
VSSFTRIADHRQVENSPLLASSMSRDRAGSEDAFVTNYASPIVLEVSILVLIESAAVWRFCWALKRFHFWCFLPFYIRNKCLSQPVTKAGCPIQARFWLEWDSTALDRLLSLLQRIPRSMIIYTMYSQRSRSVESHSSQNRA